MEERKIEFAEQATESPSTEKKDYHAPELTVYGDIRELTLTTFSQLGADSNQLEATAP